MSTGFVGSVVSLDCGDILGTYQGQVKTIDHSTQTISIIKPYRNGLKCEVNNITLNAGDIKELKILQSPVEADVIVSKEATPSRLSPAECEEEACPSPIKLCDKSRGQNGYIQRPGSGRDKAYTEKNGYGRHSANGDRYSPRFTQCNGNGHRQSPNYMDNTNGHCVTGGQRYSPPNDVSRGHRYTPTKEEMRPRRNSASASEKMKKSTTPRKIEFRKKTTTREDCFSCPTDSVLQEFDFESNLALFDKKAVFEEIENKNPNMVKMAEQKKPQKYRCDENVLPSAPVRFQQIKIQGSQSEKNTFVTDEGLVVPSIMYDLRCRLFSAAVACGFKTERQVEMVGRSTSEMVLQLIGGSSRLNPKNGHQLPTVIVLGGPHMQGAQAVSCARQLSNHNVKVHLFVPNYVKMIKPLEDELALYDLCDGKKTSNPRDLPNGPVDMIVNAMDSHDNVYLREETWYRLLEDWTGQCRAPVLALDPPTDGGNIQAKWCLSIGLPLNLQGNSAHYLCDLGFPKKVFSEVGIKYVSPFGHKFVVALHLQS